MNHDLGLLILRLGVGGMMLFAHGLPKLMGLLEGKTEFADPIGIGPLPSLLLALFAEFLCSLALIVGFQTRWAALPLLITMLVAAFIFHADDPWGRKEFALLYAIPFLALMFTGAGRYSLDHWLDRRGR